MNRMNVMDLINELQGLAEIYGDDCQVKLAFQPNYPLEYTIHSVTVLTEKGSPDVENLDDDELPVIYIAAGDQLGYSHSEAWSNAY